jgi:hypothetical protein
LGSLLEAFLLLDDDDDDDEDDDEVAGFLVLVLLVSFLLDLVIDAEDDEAEEDEDTEEDESSIFVLEFSTLRFLLAFSFFFLGLFLFWPPFFCLASSFSASSVLSSSLSA